MESLIAHVPEQKIKAVFSLGKIHNKYLIIEILSFADKSNKIYRLMFRANRNMRNLLVLNFRVFQKWVVQMP